MGALLNLVGSVAFVLLVLFFLILLAPVGLAYIALRLRDHRLAKSDPQLGLKTAFHLVQSLAVLMVLAGLSVSAADLMDGQLTGNPPNQQAQAQRGRGQPMAPPPKDEFWDTAQR